MSNHAYRGAHRQATRQPLRRVAGAAGLAVGLAAGGYGIASAASGTSTTTTPTTTPGAPGAPEQPHRGLPGMPGMPGGPHETVSDASVAAKAIGISEADLTSALSSGQTMAQVAKAHNVDVQKVVDALVADAQSELADQVKGGQLTQAQADQMKAGITQRVTDQVNGQHPGKHGGGHGFGGGPHETVSDASVAAKAIGISEADLTSALSSGQTMAQVAKAHNVDVQKVVDALVADAQSELADQVKGGQLTQAQADQMKAGITQRVTDQVNGQHPGGPGGGHGFRGGPDGAGGFGPGRGGDFVPPVPSPATA